MHCCISLTALSVLIALLTVALTKNTQNWLCFHGSSGYVNASQCYVICTLPILFSFSESWHLLHHFWSGRLKFLSRLLHFCLLQVWQLALLLMKSPQNFTIETQGTWKGCELLTSPLVITWKLQDENFGTSMCTGKYKGCLESSQTVRASLL